MENRQRKTWLRVRCIPDIVATCDQCTMDSDLVRDLLANLDCGAGILLRDAPRANLVIDHHSSGLCLTAGSRLRLQVDVLGP